MKRIVAILLVFLFALCACTGGESTPSEQSSAVQAKTVKIAGLQGPTALSLLKMWDDGEKLDGLEAEYSLLASPTEMVAALSKGEYDIAALPLNTAVNLFNKSTDYRLIGITAWGNMYVISTDTTIKTLADLASKTVWVSQQGATPDVLMRYYLSVGKLSGKVKLDYTLAAHADLAAAVISGSASTALMPEPFVSNIIAKNPDVKIVLDMQQLWAEITDGEPYIPQSALVVKGSFADENPDAVKDFAQKQNISADYCNSDVQGLATLAEKHGVTLPAASIINGTARCNIDFKTTAEARTAVDEYLGLILGFSAKDIGGALPDEKFFATFE